MIYTIINDKHQSDNHKLLGVELSVNAMLFSSKVRLLRSWDYVIIKSQTKITYHLVEFFCNL